MQWPPGQEAREVQILRALLRRVWCYFDNRCVPLIGSQVGYLMLCWCFIDLGRHLVLEAAPAATIVGQKPEGT
jgi:hypothetical protein